MSAAALPSGRKPRLTGNRCECSACGEYFNGVSGFDRHRVGRHGVDRRCLYVHEMAALGFVQNASGFWVTDSDSQRARRHAGAGISGARSYVSQPTDQFDTCEGI
jgi:predicted nucleic acid-binding Zn ribbon protein